MEDWSSHIYAEPFYQRFRELGVEPYAFKLFPYFRSGRAGPVGEFERLAGRVQRKYRLGPALASLNRDLLATAERLAPDVVFIFRGDLLQPSTVRRLGEQGAHVIGWQNDDPFGRRYPWYVWRHFVASIPSYHRLYAYRHANLERFREHGCGRVDLLRSFYLREMNFPLDPVPDSLYRCDVSFIGHWEPDGRERYVAALARVPEIDFKLWGTLWEGTSVGREMLARSGGEVPYKLDYNLALNSTKISLVFLSKLNNDTYTRRCFEITAAGTFMLSEYTEDLASLFAPGVEAEYFTSAEELVEKVRFYVRNELARERIAAAGRARLIRDGHEALDRARRVRDDVLQDLASPLVAAD